MEKVEDASTASFIRHFHSRGIGIAALYRVQSSPRYWICPSSDCKKGFSKLSLLKVHLYEHYGIRPYECSVPGCKWSFKTPFKLKRHAKTHRQENAFLCQLCNTGFNSQRNLGLHLKYHEINTLHQRKVDMNFLL
ncbi:Zinc finger X-linked protein ZXDA/ZXDB [Caligus rogercresseyi]|uniref:Zinc finger X-linked protein ZXDA/ZXDB n=1 Tax=Caligus rogercresseyi TaxID=217165 RepID=A0A7T8HMT0_CALRO|nr:Zinc finger X-linked protein ZXDA/ZXDB [Caligus rogercresseyi]